MSAGQLSFFSADALPAAPEHLEGLLCGPGQVVRRGDEARISSPALAEWRLALLLNGFDAIGLPGEIAAGPAGARVARTPFSAVLVPLAERWSTAGSKRAPADLQLDGPRLRWWVLAQGRRDDAGYALQLGPQDDDVWGSVGAALARAGLPAALLGPRADGPAYRLTGAKRLARLRELIGERPDGFEPEQWP